MNIHQQLGKNPVFTNLQNSNREFENFPISEGRLFQNGAATERGYCIAHPQVPTIQDSQQTCLSSLDWMG